MMLKLSRVIILFLFISCNIKRTKSIDYKENTLYVSNGIKDDLVISKIKISSINPETKIPNSFKVFKKYYLKTKSIRRYDKTTNTFYYLKEDTEETFQFLNKIDLSIKTEGYYWEDEVGNNFEILPLDINNGEVYYIRGVFINNVETALFINIDEQKNNISTVISESPI